MFDANARQSLGRISYYDSPEAFADTVDRLLDLGFTEFGLRYRRNVISAGLVDTAPAREPPLRTTNGTKQDATS